MSQFEKISTRDITVVTDEGWFFGQSTGPGDIFLKNPFSPVNIYYINDGAIEAWGDNKALSWLNKTVLSKNYEDIYFFDEILNKYNNLLETIIPKGKIIPTKKLTQLEQIIKTIFELNCYFVTLLSSSNDKTPESIRKKALEFRENDYFCDSTDKLIKESLKIIYPELGLYVKYIFSHEIKDPPPLSELKKRSENYVYIPNEYSKNIFIEEYAKNSSNYFTFDKIADQKELEGQICFPGKAKGRVKLIRREDQIGTFKKNDVLVTPMTSQYFLSAMQKAAAIVTDEGGITCHAAIVARELKKPCIIGTKIATKVLKDGDIVEVDANKGIVKKI